ncbi:MAG: DUF3179 domain-containing (seleno)protein, partial [Phycisphaerales bacterium JB038]
SSDLAEPSVLEFGVSGLLLNSNVVMYERETMGLWSQVGMRAISGPNAQRALPHLPFQVLAMQELRQAYPQAFVLSDQTGHSRDYSRNPYEKYFDSDRLFGEFEFGNALPAKTLGVGLLAGEEAVFITEAAVDGELTYETGLGAVTIGVNERGFILGNLPPGVTALQTFYHSWSAFYPETKILPEPTESAD